MLITIKELVFRRVRLFSVEEDEVRMRKWDIRMETLTLRNVAVKAIMLLYDLYAENPEYLTTDIIVNTE